MKKVKIYTDGACSRNPGPGGWSAILIDDGKEMEISGGMAKTTNNVMELTAVIQGLKRLPQPYDVEVYSDSAYVVNAFNQNWLENWKRNFWRTSDRKPVKNKDLWLELDRLVHIHNVKFIKVKGHSDNVLNNRCDLLARLECEKFL